MNVNYGGIELFFSYNPSDNVSVVLSTNIGGKPQFSDTDFFYPISINIGSEEDAEELKTFSVIKMMLNNVVIDRQDFPCDVSATSTFDVSVFFFNSRISININNKWVYSYSMLFVEYPVTISSSLLAVGGEIEFRNIKMVELCDGREAVYVDYEANSDSAIASIIQERPVETLSAVGRSAEFTYFATKSDIQAHHLTSYDRVESDSQSVSSDGLVYAMDVGVSNDSWVAKNLGLITRLYRLSQLDSGIERAAAALQRKARQSINTASTSGRIDPRLEVSDVLVLNNTLSGTGTGVYDRIILEDISINIVDGAYRQTTNGRRDIDVL